MKFTVERDDLAKAMSAIDRVVPSSEIVSLEFVGIKAASSSIEITGTDLNIWLTTRLQAEVDVPGHYGLEADSLSRCASACASGAQISVEADDVGARGKSGRARFKLPVLPAADLAAMRVLEKSQAMALNVTDVHYLFGSTRHAVSTEETRYYLNGIHFCVDAGQLRACSTDGQRLAVATIAAAPDVVASLQQIPAGIIIPRATIDHILRLLPDSGAIDVRVSESLISIDFGDVQMVSKLIDGSFPDTDRVIPRDTDGCARMQFDRQAAFDLINRIAGFKVRDGTTKKSVARLRITMTDGAARFSSGDAAAGFDDDLPASAVNRPLEFGINGKYLQAALGAADVKDVRLSLADPTSPILLTFPDDVRLRFVIMPYRM